MKKNKLFIVILSLLLCFSTLFFIYYKTDFIQNEGFNPSDEGVILAQSYRLLNGEIPHKDFVAIRPVFSGVIHMIHFISPLPLVESGRWFVLFENFIIALFLSLLFRSLLLQDSNKKTTLIFVISTSILTFLLNINIYTFFPWTTVDAVMFSIIGIYFVIIGIKRDEMLHTISISTGLFFLSTAALCRQTFILLPVLISFFILFRIIQKKDRFMKLLLIHLIGYFPVIIYLGYLYLNDALFLFIDQMSGRSELMETGFFAFLRYLLNSYFLPLYALIVAFILYRKITKASPLISTLHAKIFYSVIAIAVIISGVMIFFLDYSNFFSVPYDLFYLTLAVSLFHILFRRPTGTFTILIISMIALSWTSSISLGDNAPIFVTGVLFSFSLFMCYSIFIESNRWSKLIASLLIPLVIALVALSVNKQAKNNYRDLEKDSLKYNLGEIYANFGKIRTNQNTFNYYKELKKISTLLKTGEKTFTIIPNNAIFYPLTETVNYFPLDWMQSAEYVGNKGYVHEKTEQALIHKLDYVVVEKINSKVMQNEIIPLEISENNYDYMPLIHRHFKKTSYQGDFFMIMKKNDLN